MGIKMKAYKAIINPISTFGTTLRGDTIFGHLCWVLRYKFGEDKLNELLKSYENEPFLIVSDAFLSSNLPKPKAPSFCLNENLENKKENRKKIWLNLEDLQNGSFANAKEEPQILNKSEAVVKNSLNYKSFCTGESAEFAPYSEIENVVPKSDIYFLLDESKLQASELKQALEFLAKMGYGKNASTGKGRFLLDDFSEIKVPLIKNDANVLMSLSPCVLDDTFKNCYYEPFTRFGKHGGDLANDRPFKKPILLADSAAVFWSDTAAQKGYAGKAIKSHSAHQNTYHQGYAIVVSTKIRLDNETL